MENNLFDDVIVLIDSSEENSEHYLQEFLSLLKAAFYMPKKVYSQNLKTVNKATYMGSGKIFEISEELHNNPENNPKILACNFDLTAVQQKNLEDILGIKVIDRSYVILKIFELNAKTKEAKLQVEIAKLNYMKARLINDKASYSQVTSGSKKNKGEGEKKIELSRRRINNTISLIESRLKEIKRARQTMRERRNNAGIYKVAIVGYTNAGKSTLMNRLLELSLRHKNKDVLEKDALFATLETSTRLIDSYRYPSFVLTDTVGFVSKLPIYLIKAFHSTLE
jgi:GTP-binding protein HflX